MLATGRRDDGAYLSEIGGDPLGNDGHVAGLPPGDDPSRATVPTIDVGQ
jgi:hypothetical protein